MFCMSVSDIILSVGYALTSLPMPAEMPMEEELGIYWPGPRYGNTTTCNMQGFMTTFGATSMLGYIVTLCMCKFRMTLEGFSILYAGSNFLFHISLLISSHRFQFFQISDYACVIGLNLPEKIIRNVVQPVVLGLPIICGLYMSILSIYLDLNNPPTLMFAAWCTSVPYPNDCYSFGDNEANSCIVGTASGYFQVQNIFKLLLQISIIIICLSMLIVMSRAICNFRDEIIGTRSNDVNEAESPIRSNQEETTSGVEVDDFEELDDNSTRMASRRNRHKNMLRAITLQAILYIASFLLGTIWWYFPRNTYSQILFSFKLGLVLVPSTGFFNMLVFISSKVYAYKRAHGDHLSNRDILKILFTSSIEEPVVVHLHGISMVDDDCIDREIHQRVRKLQQHFPDGTEKRRAVTFAKAESENCDDDHPARAPNNVDWSVGTSGVSSKDLSLQINDDELYDLSGCSVSGIYSRQNGSSVLSFAGTDQGTLSSSARN